MVFRIVCALMILFAGCSRSTTEVKNDKAEKQIAPSRMALIKETEQFNNDLSSLNELAKQKESAFDFAAAATVWGQVHQLVSKRFGEGSWQSLNAKIAHDLAFTKSEFSSSQLETVKQVQGFFQDFKQALNNQQLQDALSIGDDITKLSKQLYGIKSVQVAQALFQSARIESRLKKFQEAAKKFHQAIEIFRAHGFGNHPEMELAHSGLANAYVQQSKLTPASANQKEATRIAGQIWGRDSLDFAVQANQLGVIYHRAGNLDVAFEILDHARAIREELLGTEHAIYAHSCLNLGAVMLDLNRPDNAEGYLKKALEIFDRDFGTDESITHRAKSHLATIYMLRKHPDQAEPLLQSLAQTLPPGSDEQLSHQYRLSIAYAKQGKYDLAKPLLETTIQQQKEQFGSADERTINSLRAYALVLERTHQSDAADTVKQHINRVAGQVDSQDFQTRY